MISPVEAWVAKRTGLNENLTAETLHNWQLAQVKKIIGYAREHSMFYRRRLEDFDENTLRDLADMQKIDFTYPSDIIRNPQEFLCVPQKEVARIITLFTSGSQGPPKRLFFTDDDLESTVDFFAWGMATMMGPGQKALILMEGKKPYTVGDLLEKALARIGVSGKIHGQVRNVTQAVAAARGAYWYSRADYPYGTYGQIFTPAKCTSKRGLCTGKCH